MLLLYGTIRKFPDVIKTNEIKSKLLKHEQRETFLEYKVLMTFILSSNLTKSIKQVAPNYG